MYTYERLCNLDKCGNSDSEIAHYLLMHLDKLDHLSVSQFVKDTGISKSTLHRFYSKGGYISFKSLLSELDDEIKQKRMININDSKINVTDHEFHFSFDKKQLHNLVKKIKTAHKVVFYGNTSEIACLKELQFYCHMNQKDVIYLDVWDMSSCYHVLDEMKEDDVLIMVETSWHIHLLYENSIVHKDMLNLDTINGLSFHKFYIGEAETSQYLSFQNIKISSKENPRISLIALDEEINPLLIGENK